MKRRIYRLKWDKRHGGWILKGPHGDLDADYNKAELERRSRKLCRMHWRDGEPSQLLIYTKRGTIGKGGRYEASYGCDSKRRKG